MLKRELVTCPAVNRYCLVLLLRWIALFGLAAGLFFSVALFWLFLAACFVTELLRIRALRAMLTGLFEEIAHCSGEEMRERSGSHDCQ